MRRCGAICAAIAFAMLVHVQVAASAAYFVSAAGSDANAGTSESAPLLTIQKAAALANPGDVVNVMNGSYGPFTIFRGGAVNAYITFRADPGQHPTINKTGGAWDAIELKNPNGGPSYVIVDGFAIVGNAQSITAAQAQAAPDYNNVTNGNCIGAGGSSNHVIIRNNNISYCPGGGIVASGDYLYIYRNVIHHNAFWSPLDTSGITVSGKDSDSNPAAKIFVYDNILYNNQNFVCNRYQTNPCRITDGEGIIVDSNKATSFGGRVRIYNNIVYNNGGPGIEVFQSQHVDVVNNTTYMNNISAAAPDPFTAHTAGGDIAAAQSNDVNVVNNIIYGNSIVPMMYAGISSVTSLYWDYNIMFGGMGAAAVGAHDLVVDPLFADGASFDFRLLTGSPAIASGTSNFAPAQDFDGVARPSGEVCLGVYQF